MAGPVINASGKPVPNPYPWEGSDYLGRKISINISWNNGNRSLTGATAQRDAGCLFSRIYFGVGGDSRPESSSKFVNVSSGNQNIPAGQLQAVGLNTIDDVLAGQISAGG